MTKKLIKPIVLAIVFIAAIIIFCITTNKSNDDLTTTMASAKLPIVSFYFDDIKIDELHGYVKEMDTSLMRDSIIPLSGERKLTLDIATYGKNIDTIDYEIRSIDGLRLVADDEVSDFTIEDNHISTTVVVPNVLTADEEYMLIFTLTDGDEVTYYYSRIMQTDDLHVTETLQFAKEFHDKTFETDSGSYFSTYMETSSNSDNTTFSYVDLTCSVRQITWGDFSVQEYSQPVISLKEINDSYNVVTINYVMSSVDESGQTQYYNVEEYFRLRQTTERMYVLNYERTTQQIFDSENTFLSDDNDIMLGIRDDDVEYASSEAGSIVAFVQQGDLYSYDADKNQITNVFSFREHEGIDPRENLNQHDIKIVKIDEAGSIDFIVYGYMNRGSHEGEVGTVVYHYDGLAHTIEEEAFIASDTSYEVLQAEMGKLLYVNDNEVLYLILEGTLYGVDLNTLKVEKVIENLEAGSYAVSESNQYFSWVEADAQYSSSTLKLMNLKSGDIYEINKGDDKYLRPLGFMGEDFVYGIANATDVITDVAGNITFPMQNLIILDSSSNEELKTYTPAQGYVSDISIENYTIKVNLISKTTDVFAASGQDSIMNREADADVNVYVTTSNADERLTTRLIATENAKASSKIKRLTAQAVISETDTSVELDNSQDDEVFYVFVKGDVLLATDNISDAITEANDEMGVVLDTKQQYVWMRARKTSVSAFRNIASNSTDEGASSAVKAISAMLAYNDISIGVSELVNARASGIDILKENLPEKEILDIQGISAEEIIFYVSQGNPVLSMTGASSAVLVTGYNSNSIFYYDPDTNTTQSCSYDEANAMFYNGGYHFITYME